MLKSIAIVGANLAGGRAAEALRSNGFDGRVVLIGEEPWRPYQRPPLSKQYLTDGQAPADFFLRDESWYEAHRVELLLGTRAEGLDLASGGIRLAGGGTVAADGILLTTGARARRLPLRGADASNVHHLRTKDDADRLANAMRPGTRLVVIGMGVIGAEVAASARMAGCDVTVVEPAATPMSRSLGTTVGRWLAGIHAGQGVSLHFNSQVARLAVEDGLARAVVLDNDRILPCEAVVVGIGVEPAVDLARGAGLLVDNGIVVDARGATSHPQVFAAGDVTNQPGFFGGRVRLETYHNAVAQAETAAGGMLSGTVGYCQPCWFWSDQYGINLQVVGRVREAATCVMRGSMASGAFTAFYLDDGILEGVLTVDRPADMAVARRMVQSRNRFAPRDLADPDLPLRTILGAGGASGGIAAR